MPKRSAAADRFLLYSCIDRLMYGCIIVYIKTRKRKGASSMLEISSKTNLLEQKSYKYSLQDVAEPNLQRDVYSYGTIPKVAFNHRRVPMSMPEEIWITDTSLRDGQQSVEPYSVDQIVNIYKLLSKLGGPYGIIRQTEFFVYSKKRSAAADRFGYLFPNPASHPEASSPQSPE